MLATSSPHNALLKAQRAAAGNCTARRSFFANEKNKWQEIVDLPIKNGDFP